MVDVSDVVGAVMTRMGLAVLFRSELGCAGVYPIMLPLHLLVVVACD